jgi:hypothetical protein
VGVAVNERSDEDGGRRVLERVKKGQMMGRRRLGVIEEQFVK